ncbi:D-xylulose reductase A [Magnaporthiopsis poae ATCC 64411]|uniref:D-xylulose reductase A n=1 Tax=Magnaporthiopsis poae (strain ATCC 64411 / 73-15) TaxID=644358 RepID=A0A0C4DPE8_MAGP6|nr:D-xylulose reductase A [Magnaporthiopsis poae ATCC 64411]
MASPTEGKSNLSFILNKPHDVCFEERPVPELATEHDVLVAVNYTGICGSDVHYWQHGAIGNFVVKSPMVLGHDGAEPSIQASLHAVRVGGRYVQGGMGRADITFPIMALCVKEVTASGSFRYGSGDYKLAIDLVAQGKVDLKALISETVAFGQAEDAFNKVKEGQVIKVLIAGPNEEISRAHAAASS